MSLKYRLLVCLVCVAMALAASGCKSGPTPTNSTSWLGYDNMIPEIPFETDAAITLVVHDQRPEVLAGQSPTYYGAENLGIFGSTDYHEGAAIATIWADILGYAFEQLEMPLTIVNVAHFEGQDEILELTSNSSHDRLLLITMLSTAYIGIDTPNESEVTVRVYDAEMNLLFEDNGWAKYEPLIGGPSTVYRGLGYALEEVMQDTEFQAALEAFPFESTTDES